MTSKPFSLSRRERLELKLIGLGVKRMKVLKRWLPLVGTAILAAVIVLRALGMHDVAQQVETVGGLVGFTSDPAVSYAELTAAVAAVTGVVLKIRSQIQAALKPEE